MTTHSPKTSAVHEAANLAMNPAVKGAAASIPSIFVPLSSLFLSPANVRKQATNIEELAATIDAQGLLQALQVTFHGSLASGLRYAVEAGGRRFRALTLLVKQGKLDADAPIEVKVIDSDKAVEVSLSENISQEPMHPADEFAAYRALVDQGQSFEVISNKFGVTVVHVQRRLKMAQVAPELLGLYRAGEATLDHVMALASTDDTERQMQVWNALPTHSRSAQALKRKLTEEELPATDGRVAVIGLDNYLAAGGSVRADLFCDKDSQYLTDPALVDMMLGELLEQEAAKLRAEGWVWVEVFESYGYDERQMHYALPKSYLPETAAQQRERQALEASLEELNMEAEEAQDDEEWENADKLKDDAETIEEKITALQESRLDLTAYDRTMAGAVVTVANGALVLYRGLAHSTTGQTGQGVGSSRGHHGTGGNTSTRPDVPEKLMLNLSSQRTVAIQAMMVSNYAVTLAALASQMAITVFQPYSGIDHALKISLAPNRSTLEKNSPSLASSNAAQMLDAKRADWLSRLPAEPSEWFAYFLTQSQDYALAMIVFATALCADAVQGSSTAHDAAAPLARALSLDMADWWQATADNYLNLVPKAKLMEAVTDTAGEPVASAMLKMKKDAAIAHADLHIRGHRWLPLPLRTPAVAEVSAVHAKHAIAGEASDGAGVDAGSDSDAGLLEVAEAA